MTRAQLETFLRSLSRAELEFIAYTWTLWARANQLAPSGSWWRWWLMMTGRGFGKTRSAAEFIREKVNAGLARRVILAGPTASVCRDVMVEGESGILACYPKRARPIYYPSKRRLVWPNGAVAIHYSSDVPDLARGAQGDLLWGEEIGSWYHAQEFFDILNPALRLGAHPLAVLTTTPKPTPLLKRLLTDARAKHGVVVTSGSTFENAANLAPSTLEELRRRYEGTRLAQRELEGKYLEDVDGAVWNTKLVSDAWMGGHGLPSRRHWEEIAISVDPSGSTAEENSEVGIICACRAAGAGDWPHAYVLQDLSGHHHALEWPKIVARAFHALGADYVVAERNYGGDLVEAALHIADPGIPVRQVTASRGKRRRAEPVVGLYEQHRVHHLEAFTELEEQMTQFLPEQDDQYDRADALVWVLTALLVNQREVSVA